MPDLSTHHEKLWTLIRGIRIAMLTTAAQDGALRSRPMATQQKRFDGSLWFFTGEDSPKVDEMHRGRHVNLSYADIANQTYVSVSGRARFTDDMEKKRELWTEEARTWFPGGPEDENLLVLEVTVDQAEYWDIDQKAMRDLYRSGRAAPDTRSIGDHRKLDNPDAGMQEGTVSLVAGNPLQGR